jgi:hypothetical protein
VFSVEAAAGLAARAGLLVERMSCGRWRGGGWSAAPFRGQHSQDIVILRPALPSEFDASAYLQLHEDVAPLELTQRDTTSLMVTRRGGDCAERLGAGSNSLARSRILARAGSGATDASSRRPLSRASRSFIGRILKAQSVVKTRN